MAESYTDDFVFLYLLYQGLKVQINSPIKLNYVGLVRLENYLKNRVVKFITNKKHIEKESILHLKIIRMTNLLA